MRLVRDAGGDQSVAFARGQRLEIPRASVPSLANISGPTAAVTVVAEVRPLLGGFVGGVWDEADAARQYALYLGPMARCSVAGGVVGHISAEGGGSPNQSYCESAACGSTSLLARAGWTCAASTYDGLSIRAYVNGTLDNRGDNHYNGTTHSRTPTLPLSQTVGSSPHNQAAQPPTLRWAPTTSGTPLDRGLRNSRAWDFLARSRGLPCGASPCQQRSLPPPAHR